MQLFSATLRGWVDPADVFILLHKGHENAFWLDRESHKTQPFSVIGASTHLLDGQDFESLKAFLSHSEFESSEIVVPFDWRPGLVGFIEYEGNYKFMQVDRAMVFDHSNRQMHFIGYFKSKAEFDKWHHAGLLRLGLAGGQIAQYQHEQKTAATGAVAELRHNSSDYLQLIEAAKLAIAAGDVYQLCLTNQISLETDIDPLIAFLKLRSHNPAPYSAFMRIGETSIASISPEQFVMVDSSGQVSSKPIKGTRPRHDDANLDAEIASELQQNEKERAENLMIVDLMRNDISRVADPESVNVPKLFEIESYSTVHQLVSTISAQLTPDSSAVDALVACFPGGSMTGAPKPSAMSLISELEAGIRGIYSGALGYFGHDGSAEFGMVIRTIIFEAKAGRQVATIGIGGGITIDSDAQAELDETQLKAKALLDALGVASPWG